MGSLVLPANPEGEMDLRQWNIRYVAGERETILRESFAATLSR